MIILISTASVKQIRFFCKFSLLIIILIDLIFWHRSTPNIVTITLPLKANLQLNYLIRIWKLLHHINFTHKTYTNIQLSLCLDSHFMHVQFLNCTTQSKNSHSVCQFRNSHFAQSDSGIVQIHIFRRTYIFLSLYVLRVCLLMLMTSTTETYFNCLVNKIRL